MTRVGAALMSFAASLAHRAGLPGIGSALGMPRPRGYRPSRAEALRYVGAETVARCAAAARVRAFDKRERRGLVRIDRRMEF